MRGQAIVEVVRRDKRRPVQAIFRDRGSIRSDDQGRRVGTTAGLACAQTTLRQWRAPHTLPSREPYGAVVVHRGGGGGGGGAGVCNLQ